MFKKCHKTRQTTLDKVTDIGTTKREAKECMNVQHNYGNVAVITRCSTTPVIKSNYHIIAYVPKLTPKQHHQQQQETPEIVPLHSSNEVSTNFVIM